MAFSPSPQPPALAAAGSLSQRAPYSRSPPPQQNLSKRDKRKLQLEDRLQEISRNFRQNRDFEYRSQLQTIQSDITYISAADPYKDQPLNDTPEDVVEEITSGITRNNQGPARGSHVSPGAAKGKAPERAGKFAMAYIDEINDAMEEKDAQLTLLAVSLRPLHWPLAKQSLGGQ